MKTKSGMRSEWLRVGSVVFPLFLLLAGAVPLGIAGCSKQGGQAQVEAKKTTYTCVMHHQIRRDKPGDCPICGMTLVPLEQNEGTPKAAPPGAGQTAPKVEKKIKFWANPMNLGQHSDKPKKDEMGMDYVPVYEETVPTSGVMGSGTPEEIQGLAPVQISHYKEQLIDVKYAMAQIAPITRVIRTTGRFAGGNGDFASLAGDFAARKPLRATGRYVVADVYALDQPLVKTGEKAYVTTLSGSGPRLEGRVSLIYPYDETQSRVTRVKITLSQAPPLEIFANVEIEAVTNPKLAVPPTSVMDTGTHRYVFVQTAPGVLNPRPITTGFEGDNLWEVTSGLKEGEKVVNGANFLIDADSKLKAAFADTK